MDNMLGNYFKIDMKLPSLNEVILKNRTNRYMGAKLKRQVQDDIGWFIQVAIHNDSLHPVMKESVLNIHYHEKTRRRDVDNIQSAQKFILDALVENGILPDDSQKWVSQIFSTVVHDDKDFVEVWIV